MARKPRIHFPGACYHVILRGNGGQALFYRKQDRSRFFILLQEGIERYGHCIHAFCLMTNHVHIAIQVGDIPLSRIMQNLSFRYTRFVNSGKKRIGHLFQGRYKAILIDVDSYLLELIRYIHLNPVRAGITKTPDEYPWSSHKAYLGVEKIEWLTTEWLLSQFAKRVVNAQKKYARFINRGMAEEHRKEFHSGTFEGRILGEDNFIERSLARAEEKHARKLSLDDLIRAVCDHYKLKQQELSSGGRQRKLSQPRAVLAYLVRETNELTLAGLSKKFERDLSGLSQAAARLEKRMQTDKNLSKEVYNIKNLIK